MYPSITKLKKSITKADLFILRLRPCVVRKAAKRILHYLCVVQACGGWMGGYFELFKNFDIVAPSLGCFSLLKSGLL